jgi:hypothetical protein
VTPPTKIDVRKQRVEISTPRGVLRLGPDGQIEGLWRLVSRELRTHAEICKMCKATPNTVRSWRRKRDFPEPVVHFTGKGGRLELWSRTEVEGWLESHETQWALAHRLARQGRA